MAVREIIQVTVTGGDDTTERILTKVSKQVTSFDDSLLALIDDLRDTMWHHTICVGLAAPQIGHDLKVAVVNSEHETREDDLILVNPVIMNRSGKKDIKRESCMSIWGLGGEVERRDKVSVRYTDGFGEVRLVSFEGFVARAVQHEIDHLDGVLYRQHLKAGTELTVVDIFDNDTWRV
jgi:peptide deformylase